MRLYRLAAGPREPAGHGREADPLRPDADHGPRLALAGGRRGCRRGAKREKGTVTGKGDSHSDCPQKEKGTVTVTVPIA
jgi:hypothetical protein